MLKELDTYDWCEAFTAVQAPEPAKPGSSVPCNSFHISDVNLIHAKSEGANDAAPWIIVCHLTDGRWLYLTAWCDYTGWDCQAGGRSWVAYTLSDLLKYGVPSDDLKALGLEAAS